MKSSKNKMIINKGNVGNNIIAENADWSFDGDVAKTFDGHVENSVPLYREGHWIIKNLVDFFLKKDSICYDIGSSTGGVFSSIVETKVGKKAKLIGIEPIKKMVETSNEKHKSFKNIKYLNKDILSVELLKSDMVISYYTIQFIQPKVRQLVIDKIFKSLNWGGAFIFFEKVRAPDARFQDINTALYTEFKVKNNFSPEEIFSKTRSLKGVLEPFSTLGNIQMLERSGFKDINSILKFGPFEGFLAIK